MTFKPSLRFLALFGALTLLLFACDGHEHFKDLREYIEQLKQRHAHEKKPALTPIAVPVPAVYQADTLRTPFETETIVAMKNASPSNPLQGYPINMLRFVGTVSVNNVTSGYILSPDNKVYQIKEGDVIGDHDGKVISVQADKITISEQDSEKGKPAVQHVVTLQLKDEE